MDRLLRIDKYFPPPHRCPQQPHCHSVFTPSITLDSSHCATALVDKVGGWMLHAPVGHLFRLIRDSSHFRTIHLGSFAVPCWVSLFLRCHRMFITSCCLPPSSPDFKQILPARQCLVFIHLAVSFCLLAICDFCRSCSVRCFLVELTIWFVTLLLIPCDRSIFSP
jgi:hypothetical protein